LTSLRSYTIPVISIPFVSTFSRGGALPVSNAQDPTQFLPLTDLAFNLLVALTGEPLHGYALLKELRLRTGRADLRTGTVYAVLARLQDEGLIRETRPPSGSAGEDPRRRYYSVTALGVRTAQSEAQRLREVLRMADAKLSAAPTA
jgi:DNA-binding PadR family transcriptional regulator